MSKLRTCSACRFYASGGKSRIAMKHTCGKEPQRRTVSFPKLESNHYYEVVIQRGGLLRETPKAQFLRCQKQVIEGVTIPAGFEFWTPTVVIDHEFSSMPKAHVMGYVLEPILKTLILNELRNG